MHMMLTSGLLLTSILVILVHCQQRQQFKAAVYEHEVIYPEPKQKVFSRKEALNATMKNLMVYNKQAMLAAKKRVDVIVFPEGGLYGMNFDRHNITPFLEHVPPVTKELWNPCTHPNTHPNAKIQYELSCIARNNSMYVVANLASKTKCDDDDDNEEYDEEEEYDDEICPEDGMFIFNTAVVFDTNGNLIARYNKWNPERDTIFDTPPSSERITFDTPFGIFGVFIGTDLNHFDPAIRMIEELGISNFVAPSSSQDNLPNYVAIREQAGFARGYGVNLLVANVHDPNNNKHGSGVYTPDGQTAFYYDNRAGSAGKLVDTTVKSLARPARHIIPEYTTEMQAKGPSPDTFVARINEVPYTIAPLKKQQGSFKLCQSELCCELEYTASVRGGDEYVFAVYSGYIQGAGDKHLFSQSCMLTRCVNTSEEECGIPDSRAHSYFTHLRINAYFSTQYVFPQFLVHDTRKQLKITPTLIQYANGVLWTRQVTYPVESAGFYGRIFSRDSVNSSPQLTLSITLLIVLLFSSLLNI